MTLCRSYTVFVIVAIVLLILGGFLVLPEQSSSHAAPAVLTVSCTNWPTPQANLNWTLPAHRHSNSIQKGDIAPANDSQFWGFIPNCGGNPWCWPQAPSGGGATSYVDTNIVPGRTYTWRIKTAPGAASNNVTIPIEACNCNGPCPPLDDAAYVAKAHPMTVMPGEDFNISFTMNNTGTSTWTNPPYRMRETNVANRALWNMNPLSQAGDPDGIMTYVFSATAPATDGVYDVLPWSMVNAGTPFGSQTPTFQITVATPPPPVVTLTYTEFPDPIPNGSATTLSWTVDAADSCTVTPNSDPVWTDPITFPGPGMRATSNLTANTVYEYSCTKMLGGTATASVTVLVDAPPDPVITSDAFCSPFGTISWSYGGPIEDFWLQVATDASFIDLVHDSGWTDSPGAMSANVPVSLDPGIDYFARVKVRDAAMSESGWSVTYPFTHPPRAALAVDPEDPVEMQPFTATDASDYGAGAPDAVVFDMGDGTIYSHPVPLPLTPPQSVMHTYADAGSQTITLTVDAFGRQCTDTTNINVNQPIPGFKEVLPQ